MKPLVTVIFLKILLLAKIGACENCISMIYIIHEKINEDYEKWLKDNPCNTAEQHAWQIGIKENTQRGLRMAAACITKCHPDTKLTIEQWISLKPRNINKDQ